MIPPLCMAIVFCFCSDNERRIRVKTCPKCKRGERKCAKMSRNHVCHCFAWKIAGPLINLVFCLFISGMAAVNVVLETLQCGDHVVASNQVKNCHKFCYEFSYYYIIISFLSLLLIIFLSLLLIHLKFQHFAPLPP